MFTTKAMGHLKDGVGVVVTCPWEPNNLGGDLCGLYYTCQTNKFTHLKVATQKNLA